MADPTREQLVHLIERIRQDCNQLEQMVNGIKPEKEWLTTTEFAERSGLSPKTVSNYAYERDFEYQRKNSKGRWLIHKSELPP